MSTESPELTILGGGPAGLSAAWYAHQQNRQFRLFEASNRFGGNAITFSEGPFRYDSGAHRFHDKDAEITADLLALMGPNLQKVEAPSQILRNGKFIDFPLTPLNLLRNLGLGMALRSGFELIAARLFQGKGKGSFEDFAIRTYGKGIAKAFLLDYSAKLWGLPPAKLSPAISGKRLKGLDLKTFLWEALFGKNAKTEHIDGAFYYPQQGIGQIFDSMAAEMGGEHLETETRVTRLLHDGHTLQTIELNGQRTYPAGWVLSSLPLTLHFKLLDPPPPDELIELAKSLTFRHIVLVALFVDRPSVSPNASLYFPEPQYAFTRVVESKNRSAFLAPENQTVLVAEVPCFTTDKIWQASDDEIIRQVGAELAQTGLIRESEILSGKVHRIFSAYPVLELGYEQKVAQLNQYLEKFQNLIPLGRNAEFAYTHIHDLMRGAKDLVNEGKTSDTFPDS